MDPHESKRANWFSEKVHVHEASLRAYLRRAFPWLRDVDDLVQDAFGKLWRRGALDDVRCGKALLFATARNAALDQHRRIQVIGIDSVADIDELSVLDERTDVAETVTRKQELDILSEAIRALPDRCRQVLTLAKLYGLSQKEIAAQLAVSENIVECQIARGMRLCAAYLRERGVEGIRHR